jgi:hypothetical protein
MWLRRDKFMMVLRPFTVRHEIREDTIIPAGCLFFVKHFSRFSPS